MMEAEENNQEKQSTAHLPLEDGPAPAAPAAEAGKSAGGTGDMDERSARNEVLLHTTATLGSMSLDDKLAFATRYKDAGNVFFKEGRLDWALANYKETLTFLQHGLGLGVEKSDGDSPKGPRPLGEAAQHIMMKCYSNMAACHLKLGNFKAARDACNKGLETAPEEPERCKLLFRRGMAQVSLGALSQAIDDLNKAANIDPSDAAIRRALLEAKAAQKAWEKEEQEAARLTFGGKLKSEAGAYQSPGGTQEPGGKRQQRRQGSAQYSSEQATSFLAGFLNYFWAVISYLCTMWGHVKATFGRVSPKTKDT
eukprot:jgi/Mesvir1/24802/Mv22055-RA.1